MARKNLENDVREARMQIRQLRPLQIPEVVDKTQYGREELQADLRAVLEQLLKIYPQLTQLVS